MNENNDMVQCEFRYDGSFILCMNIAKETILNDQHGIISKIIFEKLKKLINEGESNERKNT